MKEVRCIDNMKVRKMCIDEQFYTRGTNKEYENLLFTLCEKTDLSLDDIEQIARDILDHSDLEDKENEYGVGYDDLLMNLMGNLINDCCYSYVNREF